MNEKIKYNVHHIIPRYRCKEIGIDPDFPENLIRLTEKEHAQAHWERWLKFGDSRDKLAVMGIGERLLSEDVDMSGENHPQWGTHRSPETRAKISTGMKKIFAVKNSEGKSVAHGMTNKKQSKKYVKELSERMKGSGNINYGKTFTEEHRKKIGNGNRGKKFSKETIQKMSEAKRGKKQSPETIAKRVVVLKAIWAKKALLPSSIENKKKRKEEAKRRSAEWYSKDENKVAKMLYMRKRRREKMRETN